MGFIIRDNGAATYFTSRACSSGDSDEMRNIIRYIYIATDQVVVFKEILTVIDPLQFRWTLLGGRRKEGGRETVINMGIGHGRALGLGLLSVVPLQ